MRNAVALLLATLVVAGCNRSGGNAENSAALPTPGPRPEASTGAGNDAVFRQRYREINVASCIAAARARAERERNSALGMDFRPYCQCAVDRLMEGRSVQELVRLRPGPREQQAAEQCGREHGVLIDTGPGGR